MSLDRSRRELSSGESTASERPQKGSEADEAALVAEAAQGRSEAFETLMKRYQARIYRLVARLVNDRELALDLTQETFMKAWRGLGGFQGQASFSSWLYRIARNSVLSEQRKQAARPKFRLSLGSGQDDEENSGIEPIAASAGPEELSLARERQEQLLSALEGMVPDFREVLVLRDIERYDYESIAEMIEIPVGTVRSRLHRARLELQAILARWNPDAEGEGR